MNNLRIALVVPHLFMQDYYLKNAIFSPGHLALNLAKGLADLGNVVTLFSPTSVTASNVKNITADYTLVQRELNSRGYNLAELMSKHPLTYITLARQLQSQIISNAYKMANNGEFDIVHIYINEEDIAMHFAPLCNKPVVFTHHEPFNYLTRYRTSFEQYRELNWISISFSQRETVDSKLNWIENIYHGIEPVSESYIKSLNSLEDEYLVFLGRIIEPKGVHLAIQAVKKYNRLNNKKYVLKIAGKHYSDQDNYWEKRILPFIDNKEIVYTGFINDDLERDRLLYNAQAMLMPSIWSEPFGMVILESLRLGTPVIGLSCGALPEIIKDGLNGYITSLQFIKKKINDELVVDGLVESIKKIELIDRRSCINYCTSKFSTKMMVESYLRVYKTLAN